jgi:hypothetical protein
MNTQEHHTEPKPDGQPPSLIPTGEMPPLSALLGGRLKLNATAVVRKTKPDGTPWDEQPGNHLAWDRPDADPAADLREAAASMMTESGQFSPITESSENNHPSD